MSGVDVVARVRHFVDATWAPWKLQGIDAVLTADDLRDLLEEVERLRAAVARVEAAMDNPANRWWHTGGTACVPRRELRAALEQP